MRLIKHFFFYFLLFTFSLTCEAFPIQKVKLETLSLEECFLPKKHSLQKPLKDLFKKPEMFDSTESLKEAGFRPLNKRTQLCLMVTRHPDLPNYLIKKFKNEVPLQKQLENYLNRVSGAKALQKFIQLNHFQHIVVPKKWIYRLPKKFSDPNTGERTYILIVEEIDICSGGNKLNGTMSQKYHEMDFNILRELCIVLYYFRGLDSSLRNMPFTHQGKIAFIDTEKYWQVTRGGFLPRAMPHLSPDRQEYALKLLEELRTQDHP